VSTVRLDADKEGASHEPVDAAHSVIRRLVVVGVNKIRTMTEGAAAAALLKSTRDTVLLVPVEGGPFGARQGVLQLDVQRDEDVINRDDGGRRGSSGWRVRGRWVRRRWADDDWPGEPVVVQCEGVAWRRGGGRGECAAAVLRQERGGGWEDDVVGDGEWV
jgi:hypothetical protein